MEKYEAPVAEIVTFAMQDIVTASADCPAEVLDSTPFAYEPSNW